MTSAGRFNRGWLMDWCVMPDVFFLRSTGYQPVFSKIDMGW
jgi:hypothetical protein